MTTTQRLLPVILSTALPILFGTGLAVSYVQIETRTWAEGHDNTSAAGEDRLNRMITAGHCWSGGTGHPYPSRVWVKINTTDGLRYELRGQVHTDALLSDASRWDEVAAFCR